jgi:DNA helicase-2/ATP-dependent DNA helicase PcrA
MTWDTGLTGVALQIAGSIENPLRVMAGPGTGKTFAMKRRVARLLEEGVEPTRILVVTFTRTKAANLVSELRDLGVAGCDEIRAGTLHSFCFSLLWRADVFSYLARVPRPLVTFNKSGVMRFEAAPLLADLNNVGGFGPKRESTSEFGLSKRLGQGFSLTRQDGPSIQPITRSIENSSIGFHFIRPC